MTKAIIFEFFDVLVLHGSDSFALTYFPDDSAKNSQVKQLQLDRERGLIDFGHFVSKLAAVGGVDQPTALQFIDNYQPNVWLINYIHDKLKPQYKIYLISNTSQDWPSRILGSTDLAMFDDIIAADKFTLDGFEIEFYKLIAKNLGLEAKECLYIGYLPSYCQAAEDSGMRSLCYWGFKQIQKEFELQGQ